MNDMLVKSCIADMNLANLGETFATIKKFRI